MNSPNRSKAIFYAIALLVLGGIIGAMMRGAMPAAQQTLRVGRVDEIATAMRTRLYEKLALTEDQKQRIEPKIKAAAEEMEAAHLEALVEVNRVVDKLHAAIKPELIPEQLEKLRELEAERAERMKQKYNFPPGTTNAASLTTNK